MPGARLSGVRVGLGGEAEASGAGLEVAAALSRSATTRRFPDASMPTSAKNPLSAAPMRSVLVHREPVGGQSTEPEVICTAGSMPTLNPRRSVTS